MLDTYEVRSQLLDRKNRLEYSIDKIPDKLNLVNLLKEVDSALERLEDGEYGVCQACHGAIENELLRIDPLVEFCLDCLDAKQKRLIEQDLDLAYQIQLGLLPQNNITLKNWEINFHYEPAGLVSGDYCDLVKSKDGSSLYFIIGDVSGKGIAASMLMMHIHAMFHSLIEFDLSLTDLVMRVNRLLLESTFSSQYSTLILGKLNESGEMEIVNAGHNYPIVFKENEIIEVVSTGIPLGLFANAEYGVKKFMLNKNESIFLYTDGFSEARYNEKEYGKERIIEIGRKVSILPAKDIVSEYLKDLKGFLNGSGKADDLTILALKKTG
jgi:sigma-B regulation protein RsbU (phosphoserine phosphatase)